MKQSKNRVFPIIITVLTIVIIIYLFATVKQPLVVCDRSVKNDLRVTVSEVLETTIDGSKIKSMTLTKTIILPEEYLIDDTYLESIMLSLENSYLYLDDEKVTVSKMKDRVIAKVVVDAEETIILNNIEFFYNDDLEMSINPNTKSSGVITLRVRDSYTEGELKTRLKNNGYSCK